MNSLKLGEVLVTREPIPHCPNCVSKPRPQWDCALCAGSGYFHECDCCGRELMREEDWCYQLTRPLSRVEFYYDVKQGWVERSTVSLNPECIGRAIEDAMSAMPEPQRHGMEEAS